MKLLIYSEGAKSLQHTLFCSQWFLDNSKINLPRDCTADIQENYAARFQVSFIINKFYRLNIKVNNNLFICWEYVFEKAYPRSPKNIYRQIETPVTPTWMNTSHQKICLFRHVSLALTPCSSAIVTISCRILQNYRNILKEQKLGLESGKI